MDRQLSNPQSHEQAAQLIPWLVNGTLDAETIASLRAHLHECAQCRADHDEQRRWHGTMRVEGPLVFAAEPSFQKLMSRLESGDDGHEVLDSATELVAASPAEGHFRAPSSAAETASNAAVRAFTTGRSTRVVRWLAAAVVLEAIALGFGAWAWHGQGSVSDAPYVTLTSAQPTYGAGPRVRVVFRPELSLEGLKTLLHTIGAHIIDGPTDANVYTLGFAQATFDDRTSEAKVASFASGSKAPQAAFDKRTNARQLEGHIAVLRASPSVLFAEPAPGGDSQ